MSQLLNLANIYAAPVLTYALKFLFPILLMPFALELAGPDVFGNIAALYSIVLICAVFVDMGASVYGPIHCSNYGPRQRGFWIWSIIVLKGLVFTIGYFIVLLIPDKALFNQKTVFIALYSIHGLGTVFDFAWVYTFERRFWLLLKIHFTAICLVLIVYLISSRILLLAKNVSAIIIVTGPFFFSSLLCWISLSYENGFLPRNLKMQLLLKIVQSEIQQAMPILCSQVISSAYSNAGPFLLAKVGKTEVAGFWLILNRLILGVGNFASIPFKSDVGLISKSWTAESRMDTTSFWHAVKLYCILVFPFIIGLALFKKEISAVLFKGRMLLSGIQVVLSAIWCVLSISAASVTAYLVHQKNGFKLNIATASTLMFLFIWSAIMWSRLDLTAFLLGMIFSQGYILALFVKNIYPLKYGKRMLS
jgi:O-antigen/teichoic acid export membrane protein